MYAKNILAALREIQINGPSEPRQGICSNLLKVLKAKAETPVDRQARVDAAKDFLEAVFSAEGLDAAYPVEGDMGRYEANRGAAWSPESAYGRRRKALLDKCARYAEVLVKMESR